MAKPVKFRAPNYVEASIKKLLNGETLSDDDKDNILGQLDAASSDALDLDLTIAGAAGAVTINKVAGQARIALGASSVAITNTTVTANSLIFVSLVGPIDSTLKEVVAVPTANTITITGNTTATAAVKVNFLVVNAKA
jgi:hypothetical protein